MVQKGTGKFEILSGDEIITSGSLSISNTGENILTKVVDLHISDDCVQLGSNDFYAELSHRGHNYNGKFKSIKSAQLTENGSVTVTSWNNDWYTLIDAMVQQYIFNKGEKYQKIVMPTSISRIAIALNALPKEEDKGKKFIFSWGELNSS